MKYTRHTKLYLAKDSKNVEIIFRTLTITELSVIDHIKDKVMKAEMAYELGYISGNEPNFFAKYQIGQDIISSSVFPVQNEMILSLTLDDLKSSLNDDFVINVVTSILGIIPNTSIEYLFNLTYLDLLELGLLCEKMTNKKLFNISTGAKSVLDKNKPFFKDDGKTLQEKMKEMSDF